MEERQALIEMGQQMDGECIHSLRLAALLLRVRDREGQLVPLVANAAQRRFEELRGRQNIVLKARQMGITTWVAGRFFLKTILRPGTLTLEVAHTQAAAESIFRMVQRMWEELPEELRKGPLARGRANVRQMTFPKMDSEYRVGSACEPNVGRGLSLQNLHCSEVGRWPGDAGATLAGLRAALTPDGELVMESTPNGAYGGFYQEWSAGAAELVRHFLPWWLEPAYAGAAIAAERLTEPERLLMERHGLTAAQIGFRRGLEAQYGGLRAQEFAEDAETCFRATGTCCFEVEALELRMQETDAPRQIRRGGALEIWLGPTPGCKYVVAVDPAGGGEDGDFAAAQVVELRTGLQCAELQERLRPAELARVAAELAREYGGAALAVERNNHGAAVLAYLETRERYAAIWRAGGGEPGWLTTAASKPEMIARLGSLLEQTPQRFMSRRLLAECRTFVAGERGRTAAAGGAHDDLVMAMAVAHAVRAEMLEYRAG